MIYVCEEFGLKSNSSVSKLLKYLDKTNQDLVITPRKTDHLSKARTAQTHVRQVSGTVANVKANGIAIQTPLKLYRLPADSLIHSWSRNHTIQIKRRLDSSGLNIQSLIRDGDLGIRSTKETVPIGVILKGRTACQNSTRVRQSSFVCYALSYTGYEAVSNAKYLLADCDADLIIFINQMGKWQLLTR